MKVRFLDGSPSLETIIAGIPQLICSGPSAPCYLTVNGQNVTQSFYYGTMTNFINVTPGTLALVARTVDGYDVGPLKTDSLAAGKRYTLVVVGSYPKYQVLTFSEPASGSGAQLSLYEASPAVPQVAFGSFRASNHSGFQSRGTAKFGAVATVSLGAHVSDIGGYVGASSKPVGEVTPAQLYSFDSKNVLPYQAFRRLSLFLFDSKPGTGVGPVFGSLDR